MSKPIADLLTYRKIPVSSSYVEQLISSHPDYPSLLAIVDTLNRLGIPNIAAKIEKEQLVELEFPYVLQLTRQKDLILIRSAKDLDKNKMRLEDWNGVVFHVEPTKTINDPENDRLYKRNQFFTVLGFITAIAVLIPFVWSALMSASALTSGIWVASVIGLVTGYFLVGKDIGVKFDAVENFCTPAQMKNDCDTILKSEGATLFGVVKLSDMVFIYFLCQVCCLAALAIVPQWNASIIQTLAVVSLAAIPMVIYSLIYQYNAGAWCKLCLIVDAVLVVEVTIFALNAGAWMNATFHPGIVTAIVLGSLFIASIVLLFKGQREEILEIRKIASDAARIKNSPAAFSALSSELEKEVEYYSDQHLIYGRKDAPLKFVMASNLYCGPCGTQHKKIEKLVDLYPDYISVEYRFIPAKDKELTPNSNQYIIEYWMRNIRGRENESELTGKLMTGWYENLDLQKFRALYPMQNEMPSSECVEMEKAHLDWRTRQDVLRTPTFYLNGVRLPKEYWPDDFSVMIPSLVNLANANALHAGKRAVMSS